MIDQQTVERILDAAHIEEVVGDFVTLKKRGANYIACCPFHNEKTPSFSVSPVKGIFKCFGCGKAGSAVSFVMEHEHVSYVEALKYLANKYGIEVAEREERPEDAAKRLFAESLLIVNSFAGEFFTQKLHDPQDGYIGLSYFKERGFTDETIQKFALGYAPDKPRAFTTQAQLKGYKSEHLIATGLTCQRENSEELFDRFRERVMFPWRSISGKIIAFGGRILNSDKSKAKYVNSPESEIFVKNKSLYGIFEAKNAIAKKDNCYLVEGYTDVIQFHQSGIENVVASGGTSLTSGQIALIKRFTNNITVLYDGDWAGIKASIRGIDMFLKEGMNVRAALFPDGEDPDSYAKKHTREEMEEFLEQNAEDFIDFKYRVLAIAEDAALIQRNNDAASEHANNNGTLDGINGGNGSDAGKREIPLGTAISRDPIKRARVISELVNSIALIPDAVLRTLYTDSTAKKLSLEASLLADAVAKAHQKVIENNIKEEARQRTEALRQERRQRWSGDTANLADSQNPDGQQDQQWNGRNSEGSGGYADAEERQNAMLARLKKKEGAEYFKECETEIIYYLLRFGADEFIPGEAEYGKELPPAVRVDTYVKENLDIDGIQLQDPLLREMYNSYFAHRNLGAEKLLRLFLNNENPEISTLAANLISQPYEITIKEFNKSLVPEKVILNKIVPKSILIYKAKVVSNECIKTQKEIEQAQKAGDTQHLLELLKLQSELTSVKNRLSREAGRITL